MNRALNMVFSFHVIYLLLCTPGDLQGFALELTIPLPWHHQLGTIEAVVLRKLESKLLGKTALANYPLLP